MPELEASLLLDKAAGHPIVKWKQTQAMKQVRFSLLSFAFTFSLLNAALASEPTYTPAEIDELVRSGSAREHGAAFANQGFGCWTYLWSESDRHHLFVFLRNGVSYGEFRDEVLLDGRFISITEQYLVADSREESILQKTKVLQLVRRQELPIWKDEECIGSTIRWSFLSTALNGDVLKSEATMEKRMVRGVISVVFSASLDAVWGDIRGGTGTKESDTSRSRIWFGCPSYRDVRTVESSVFYLGSMAAGRS